MYVTRIGSCFLVGPRAALDMPEDEPMRWPQRLFPRAKGICLSLEITRKAKVRMKGNIMSGWNYPDGVYTRGKWARHPQP